MNVNELQGAIEAVLFASGEPVSLQRLSEALEVEKKIILQLIHALNDSYEKNENGIYIAVMDNQFQMCSKIKYAPYIKKILDIKRNVPLSQAAMEVLAVIAYNQPVSRSFVEQVRGVDSSGVMTTLQEKDLIEEAGRLDLPGRPISYKVTANFMRCFGLNSLKQLPPLPKDEQESQAQELEGQESILQPKQ